MILPPPQLRTTKRLSMSTEFDAQKMGSYPAEDYRKIEFPGEVLIRVQGEAGLRSLGSFSDAEECGKAMRGSGLVIDRVAYYRKGV